MSRTVSSIPRRAHDAEVRAPATRSEGRSVIDPANMAPHCAVPAAAAAIRRGVVTPKARHVRGGPQASASSARTRAHQGSCPALKPVRPCSRLVPTLRLCVHTPFRGTRSETRTPPSYRPGAHVISPLPQSVTRRHHFFSPTAFGSFERGKWLLFTFPALAPLPPR